MKLLSPFSIPWLTGQVQVHVNVCIFGLHFLISWLRGSTPFTPPPACMVARLVGYYRFKNIWNCLKINKTPALTVLLASQSISCSCQIYFPTPHEGWSKVSVNIFRIVWKTERFLTLLCIHAYVFWWTILHNGKKDRTIVQEKIKPMASYTGKHRRRTHFLSFWASRFYLYYDFFLENGSSESTEKTYSKP